MHNAYRYIICTVIQGSSVLIFDQSWTLFRTTAFTKRHQTVPEASALVMRRTTIRSLPISFKLLLRLSLQDPEPLPYLQHQDPYTFNINLFVSLKGITHTHTRKWLNLFYCNISEHFLLLLPC